MEDRSFLHSGEQLLVSMRPAFPVYIVGFFMGLFEGLIVGIILAGLAWYFELISSIVAVVVIALVCALGIARHMRHLGHSSFRVTTDRILILHHHSFFKEPLKTIRWDQYQESIVGKRSLLDALFRVRPIVIRYGNPDSKLYWEFPALRYAEDLKHYLDKAYSLVRSGKQNELNPFVLKPRGKRD
jgi:hypothetical protein